MPNVFERIAAIGVVPVIAIENPAHAVPLADALLAGGLPIAEITFRTAAAAEVIARMAQERPALLVGAGTVLDRISLDIAIKSGAQFGLAPGFDAEIVDHAADAGFPFVPGIMTPSELSAAMRRGAQAVKFFPAGTIGGPEALKSIAAPFAHLGLKFIPTGGVSPGNLQDWLKVPGVAAVGGTWIAKTEDIRAQAWDKIAANARDAVAAINLHRHARA
ncbi:bifunctional 4-hydroxy-2-oxoglutarate aldolase/2-dehydro-3-deoxy-phosphogluconate aldolase [Dongia sedimenti]|uniref:2-dehydro-3-deoxy-phosphogluconate aldolase n=1 Tax=Dongia sedimenti TaxID=3064282 RepID=A0ABU0YMZ6_9PROT|nr:bifunctional 4-hydroxy-2-oxoglutarate aldolase/2-dehydro-3-deoxy-phosphogluconate aldolase [Rhodospirillaceae bacterium R-7]